MLPNPERFVNRFADFIVHELTHYRQRVLIQRGGIVQNRGAHRDVGWFQAIAEAAPRYLGVTFSESAWPKQKPQPGRLTEVEVTHWPGSFRDLVAGGDPRLRII